MNSIKFQASPVFHAIWNALNEKRLNDNGTLEHVYKLILEEGSSRSTKTWSNFQVLFLYLYHNPICSATILRDTQKSCRDIVEKDWRDWLKDPMVRKKQLEKGLLTVQEFDELINKENLYQFFVENKTNHTWTFKHNGNMLRFTGLDDEDDAMGMTQTICWINEPYGFSKEVYMQLSKRSKVILFDWNPKQNHWVEKEKLRDNTFIHYSTFLDNPFLPAESKNELLATQPIKWSYLVVEKHLNESEALVYNCGTNTLEFSEKHIKELKRCQYNERVKTADEYHWLVYGLGKKSEKPNKIYKGWKAITLAEYNKIDEREYFGLDFGWAKPTALVGVKYDGDKSFYVRPALYKPMNEMRAEDGTAIPLGEFLTGAGFPQGNVTYGWADSSDKEAGSDLSLIQDLRDNYLLNLVATNKPTYKARWELITKMNVFYVEDVDFENEYDNYELEYINGAPTGKPVKKDDHCFIGSTMITTDNGNVMIKDIKVGDNVLTSNGYKKVLKTWDNGIKNTLEYFLYIGDDIVSLTCTPNHRVQTNLGWTEISKLQKGMTVFLNNTTKESHLSYKKEKDILIMDRLRCIGTFGNARKEKDQKVTISTTLTRILTTIELKILSYLNHLNILECTEKKDLKIKSFLKCFKMQEKRNVNHGIKAKQVCNGTRNTQKIQISDFSAMESKNVNYAVMNLKSKQNTLNFVQENAFLSIGENRELITKKEPANFAQKNTRQTNIVGRKIVALVVLKRKDDRVYDLTVEDEHEYFANGLLVHNCMNAFEYACWGIKQYLDIKL